MALKDFKRAWELLEMLDAATYNHSNRVKRLMEYVLNEMGTIDEEMLYAAQFHDIGKLYIPTRILDKHGGLNPLEREIIDRHAYYGYQILKSLPFSERTNQIVLFHHGYRPEDAMRLRIEPEPSVLSDATILMTIDRFEALTTDRAYHRSTSKAEALDIIERTEHHEETLRILKEMGEESDGCTTGNVFASGNI